MSNPSATGRAKHVLRSTNAQCPALNPIRPSTWAEGLLHRRVLTAAVKHAVDRLASDREPDRIVAIRKQLAVVEGERANLTAAVAAGGDLPTLLAALRNRESQHRALLDRIAQHSQLEAFEPSAVLAELQGRLADWRSLLRDNATSARGLLKQLLVGRLEMQPDLELGFYRFSGIGTVAGYGNSRLIA
jgi:hypothetical protein